MLRAVHSLFLVALVALTGCSSRASSSTEERTELLHVSYDPTRELFEQVNTAFTARHRASTGVTVDVRMSHGGSGRQARAVIDGLEADVVSLALPWDVDALVREAQLLPSDWATRLPERSTPWYSTIVFVVRRGNPRGVHGWSDLVRGDVQLVTPNPRTSGGARWTYLAAWGWARRQPGGSDETATTMLRELYRRVPVLASGARGASTTFAENGIGDVLLTWENEAYLLLAEHPELEIVVPDASILAEPPVAWVDHNVDDHHTRELAEAYVRFFWEEEAQEIAARNHYRPRSEAVMTRHRADFPEVSLFTVEEAAGGWASAQERHFAEGGLFDRLTAERGE